LYAENATGLLLSLLCKIASLSLDLLLPSGCCRMCKQKLFYYNLINFTREICPREEVESVKSKKYVAWLLPFLSIFKLHSGERIFVLHSREQIGSWQV
jgi:hypothetical protein